MKITKSHLWRFTSRAWKITAEILIKNLFCNIWVFGREKGKQGEREMNPSKREQNFPMDGGCDLELHEQV